MSRDLYHVSRVATLRGTYHSPSVWVLEVGIELPAFDTQTWM